MLERNLNVLHLKGLQLVVCEDSEQKKKIIKQEGFFSFNASR